jgi:hypothetical protein
LVKTETVLFDEHRIVHLEYSPQKVELLETMDGKYQFLQGKDYEIDEYDAVLKMTRFSSIPSLRLVGGNGIGFDRFVTLDGLPLLFSEGSYIHEHQLRVAYTHKGEKKGLEVAPLGLSQATKALAIKNAKQDSFRIVLVGDSISCGSNASSVTHSQPFQLPYDQLFIKELRSRISAPITFSNLSRGGEKIDWSLQKLSQIITLQPDIVIVAFGMNDATAETSPLEFAAKLDTFCTEIHTSLPYSQVVLLSGILPNPKWSLAHYPLHWDYHELMMQMEKDKDYCIFVDCKTISLELYKRKQYADFTGNNINHPNDYMHDMYAKSLINLLE